MPHVALQLAAAAEINQAEESKALSSLADSGFSSSSAIATAVHNCRYRPYIARQVIICSPVQCHVCVQPAQAMTGMGMSQDRPSLNGLTQLLLRVIMKLLVVECRQQRLLSWREARSCCCRLIWTTAPFSSLARTEKSLELPGKLRHGIASPPHTVRMFRAGMCAELLMCMPNPVQLALL